jgi:hypothetical protein
MIPTNWISILSVVTNISIIAVGIKLIRHISRMEMKVDLMWMVFVRRFGGSNLESEAELGDFHEG